MYEDEEGNNIPSCDCGLEAVIRTARTEDNPGRRFYGCPKYKVNYFSLLLNEFYGFCSTDLLSFCPFFREILTKVVGFLFG